MHEIELTARKISAGQSGLVCGDEDHEARGFELLEWRDRRLIDLEFRNGCRNQLMLTIQPDLVQYAVTFDKNADLHSFAPSIKLAESKILTGNLFCVEPCPDSP